MILTEAVVAGALAAIAELQVGIVRVRAAADGAFVVIGRLLLLLLRLMHRAAEVHRTAGMAVLRFLAQVAHMGRNKNGKVRAAPAPA